MTDGRAIRRPAFTAVVMLALLLACGEESTAPVSVASVQVTSPIGSLLDVGASTQLAAAAKDGQGATVSGVAFTWTSSDPNVVSVTSGGQIQAVAVGSATIRAAADGASGSVAVTVVDADLAGITAAVTDPYLAALVGGTSSSVNAALQTAMTQCTTGVGEGSLESVQDCIAAVRSQVAAASDQTDRALLAVLSLFVDEIERLINA